MQPKGTAKFQPRFVGPFKVLQRIGKVAYCIGLPPSMQAPVFHVSLLQRDKPRPQEMLVEDGWEPVDPGCEKPSPSFQLKEGLGVWDLNPRESRAQPVPFVS